MKNVSGPEGSIFRKKGFFIALYSCLGAVAVLAFVVTFTTRNQSGQDVYDPDDTVYVAADQVDSYLAQMDPEAWFRPRQTPAPTPPATPPQQPPRQQPPPQSTTPPEPPAPNGDPPADSEPQATPEPPPAPPAPRVETFEPFTEYDNLVWPVYGEIVMPFSMSMPIFDQTLDQFRTNDNLLISAPEGEAVRSGADGRVIAIGNHIRRGNYVTIDHGDGWVATYGQLMDNILVSEGEIVRTGQVIGGVGQPSIFGSLKGTHVHLRVLRDDEPVNPYYLLQTREN
ncbi:MAG: M23 family metallopeptidase [Defluviitaleaceae bacterium]|nr:M23 family metallopeptidase [Defluviitaleaceae bacterium]